MPEDVEPRARRVPPPAVRDPRRRADRDPRRRSGRRARSDRRPLDKAARRAGAEVVETRSATPAGGIARVRRRARRRLRETERTILIWSGPGGNGGATIAGLAAELGLAEKPGSGAFHLPETANGRGVADGWAAAADGEDADPEPIELLIVSGDEAAANPDVRALAERARTVLAISMFRTPLAGWADLVLPGTSYLERDGTYVNLEGRLQRLRRAVIPPCPDELAWIAKLAERFGIELSPHAPQVFAELSERCYGGLDYPAIGDRAALPERRRRGHRPPVRAQAREAPAQGGPSPRQLPAALLRPGRRAHSRAPVPAPAAEIELSAADAAKLGVASRRAGQRPLERHLGRAPRAREQGPRHGRRP